MKKEQPSAHSRKITLQLSQEEFYELQGKLLRSAYSDLNDYLHDLIQNGTVGTNCRNQSIDEFLGVAIGLKNELNAIGKNFNQAVKRLHEIYHLSSQKKDDLEYYQAEQFSLGQKIEEMRQILLKILEVFQSQSSAG